MRKGAIILAGLTMLASSPAVAADYIFKLTGDATVRFTLPNSPIVDPSLASDYGFRLENVTGTFNGRPDNQIALAFYNGTLDKGGLEILSYDNLSLIGQQYQTQPPLFEQLFTGSEAQPTFRLGTYALNNFDGSGSYSLSISAVPEPATWGMMILGFGVAGVSIRYRRRSIAAKAVRI